MKTIISGIMLGLIIIILPIRPVVAQEVVYEVEPNHTMGLGQPITPNQTIIGNIGVSGDTLDWYRMNSLRFNDLVQIILNFDNTVCNIDLEVWDDETTMLWTTTGGNSQKELKFTPTDFFYIRIQPTSGQGDYSFIVNQQSWWDDFGEGFLGGGGC